MADRILLTGHQGYIGTALMGSLLSAGYEADGVDMGYYSPFSAYGLDVRGFDDTLSGIDAVVHLAALSNDPTGALNERLTFDINHDASVRLAERAKGSGVRRFIFASSQSIYGIANGDDFLTEGAPKMPLTAYAMSKMLAEKAILAMASPDFTVCALRAATVFGWSPRFRSDIVFNNLLASAYTTKRIEVRSDGSPWRPVVHIQDLCDAYLACLKAPSHLINGKAFNVGVKNYTVLELADIVAALVPGAKVTFGLESADERSYRTDGTLIHKTLGELLPMKPRGIREEGRNMLREFERVGLTEEQFRGRATNRLAQLKALMSEGKLDAQLRWK